MNFSNKTPQEIKCITRITLCTKVICILKGHYIRKNLQKLPSANITHLLYYIQRTLKEALSQMRANTIIQASNYLLIPFHFSAKKYAWSSFLLHVVLFVYFLFYSATILETTTTAPPTTGIVRYSFVAVIAACCYILPRYSLL